MESELPIMWLLFINILAWFFIHMSISFGMLRVSEEWLASQKKWFQPKKWEKNGLIWQEVFRIRQWKKYLPDGSLFIKSSYDQTNLQGVRAEQLKKFIIETKRAELTHWLMIPPAALFFIWNPPWAGLLMVVYALVFNLPLIMTQRYNRPRLERLYRLKKTQ